MFAAWIAVKLVPFRRLVGVPRLVKPRVAREADRSAIVTDVAWAVRCADRALPVFNCFHRGLTAQGLLRARGVASTLHYGAAQSAGAGLYAHVWLVAGDLDVVGCETATEYGVLASFAA